MKNSWRYTSCGAQKMSDASSIAVDLQYPHAIAYMFQSSLITTVRLSDIY